MGKGLVLFVEGDTEVEFYKRVNALSVAVRTQLGTVLKLNPILLTIKTYRYTIAISTLKKDLLWLIRITMLMR